MSTESDARDLANKIEGLNIKSTDADVEGVHKAVNDELNQMPLNHRANVANEMERMIKEDHAANSSLPAVELAFSKDSNGTEHVEDIKVKLHGEHTGWFGMNQDKTVDVYDNPGRSGWAKLFGPNIISQAVDTNLTSLGTIGKDDDPKPPSGM